MISFQFVAIRNTLIEMSENFFCYIFAKCIWTVMLIALNGDAHRFHYISVRPTSMIK